jgi:Uma2 family endonuclease
MNDKVINSVEKVYSVEDYLRTERKTATNQELIDGKILTTQKSSRIHSLLVTNATISIGSRLSGQNCEIYAGNMRVQVTHNRFCYPSVVVVNGKPVFSGKDSDTLMNPTIVFEIFSSENRPNSKIESFLEMESVKDCLLIKENELHIEHYAKQTNKQWLYKVYNERSDVITLSSVNCKTSVAEVYTHVNFGLVGHRQVAA